MKRTALKRSAGLSRRFRLRSCPRPRPAREDAARAVWKAASGAGYCEACDRFAMNLEGHHVYPLEMLKQIRGAELYSFENRMDLCPRCHGNHTSAFGRIPMDRVPDAAVAWLVDLVGEGRATRFFAAHYGQGRGRAV